MVVDVEHSRFEPSYLRVVAGTEVRFVLTNDDPINHELIVGPPEVHERHEGGHEAEHPPVPGRAVGRPDEQGVTSYVFDTPGTVEMACHLRPLRLRHARRGRGRRRGVSGCQLSATGVASRLGGTTWFFELLHAQREEVSGEPVATDPALSVSGGSTCA